MKHIIRQRKDSVEIILLVLVSIFCNGGKTIAQDWDDFTHTPIVPKYEKFELSLRADQQSIRQKIITINDAPNNPEKLNPFNPDYRNENGISLEAVFSSPSGIRHKVFGFYTEDWKHNSTYFYYEFDPEGEEEQYHWRIRFSPNETGAWTYTYTFFYANQKGYEQYSSSGDFTCIESSNHGFLKVGQNKAYLQFDDGTSFFGIGENLSSASFWAQMETNHNIEGRINRYRIHRENLIEMAANKGNYARVWTSMIDYAVDFRSPEQYLDAQIRCFEIENFVEEAERHGVYLQFVVQNSWGFGEGERVPEANWEMNPYNDPNILDNQADGVYSFFKTDYVKKLWIRKLRYYLARWGYSKNIACWELWNEPENLFKYAYNAARTDSITRGQLAAWLVDAAKSTIEMFEMETGDLTTNYNHQANFHPIMGGMNNDPFELFMGSTSLDVIHLLSMHSYGSDRTGNHYFWNKFNQFQNPSTMPEKRAKRPMNWGEIYSKNAEINECTHTEFHRKLWATAMAGGFTTGLSWFYYNNNEYGRIVEYADIEKFFRNENMQDYGLTIPSRYPDAHWYTYYQDNKNTYPYMHSLYMVSNNKKRGMGWAENPTHYWYNFPDIVACCDSATSVNNTDLKLPSDDDGNKSPIYENLDKTIILKGLNPDKWYKVEWYRTQDLKYIASSSYQANSSGEITLEAPESGAGDFDQNDPYYPDYAYKFYEIECDNSYPLLHNGWERVCASVNHKISAYSSLFVGDFDGNGVDDILGFDDLDQAALFEYQNRTINNLYMSNNGDVANWDSLSAYKENMWIGDFDGDNSDEILASKSSEHKMALFKLDVTTKNFHLLNQSKADNTWDGMELFDAFLIGDFDGTGTDKVLVSSAQNHCVALYRFDTIGLGFIKDYNNVCNAASWDSIASFTDYWWTGNFDRSNDPITGKKDELVAFSFHIGVQKIFRFDNNAFREIASMPLLQTEETQLHNFVSYEPWSGNYDGDLTVLDMNGDGIDELMAGNRAINSFTEFYTKKDTRDLTFTSGSFRNETQIADMPAIKINIGNIQKFNDGEQDMLLIKIPCGNDQYVGLYQKANSDEYQQYQPPNFTNGKNTTSIYPNPTSGMIEIESEEEIFKYEVFNSNGQKIKTGDMNKQYYLRITLTNASNGIYLLKLWTVNTCKRYKIVIVE